MNKIAQNRWIKTILIVVAFIIVIGSLWYMNSIMKQIAQSEKKNVELWAKTIQQRASLLKETQDFLTMLENEERQKMNIWAEATKRIINSTNADDLSFYATIISSNNSIPILMVDENNKILSRKNVEPPYDTITYISQDNASKFFIYSPIEIDLGKTKHYLYYADSRLIEKFHFIINDIVDKFLNDIVKNNINIPVIVTDTTKTKIYACGNIDTALISNSENLYELINSMEFENQPLTILLPNGDKQLIFYKSSQVISKMRWFILLQLVIILAFIIVIIYFSRALYLSEKDSIWIGMAKETAHQMGTPLSSLFAWIDLLENEYGNSENINEMKKDLNRLQRVSDRFNIIGSKPKYSKVSLTELLMEIHEYFIHRIPYKKIDLKLYIEPEEDIILEVNAELLSWAIENIVKNALDSLDISKDKQEVEIRLSENEKYVFIDVTDTGRGIPNKIQKYIFKAGFSTKEHGWGLGLALAKRIVEQYHRGKIFIVSSTANGTRIRIQLRKSK